MQTPDWNTFLSSIFTRRTLLVFGGVWVASILVALITGWLPLGTTLVFIPLIFFLSSLFSHRVLYLAEWEGNQLHLYGMRVRLPFNLEKTREQLSTAGLERVTYTPRSEDQVGQLRFVRKGRWASDLVREVVASSDTYWQGQAAQLNAAIGDGTSVQSSDPAPAAPTQLPEVPTEPEASTGAEVPPAPTLPPTPEAPATPAEKDKPKDEKSAEEKPKAKQSKQDNPSQPPSDKASTPAAKPKSSQPKSKPKPDEEDRDTE